MNDLDYSSTPRPRDSSYSDTDKLLCGVPGVELIPEDQEAPDEWAPPSNTPLKRPITATGEFVDNFIQLGQGSPKRMRALRNHLLKAVDDVLDQPQLDEPHRNDAISLKKLLKGDGSWVTQKFTLGWIINTL